MDGTRFDDFARGFAYRLTRRRALSGAAGLTAALLGVRGVRDSAAATDIALRRYSSVRFYTTNAAASEVKGALADLLPQLQTIIGFIDYSVINGAGDQIVSVAVFTTAEGLAQAAKLEAQWVRAHATALTSAGKTASGPVILHGGTGAGCPCITGTANPCNSDALTCCGTTSALGGPGVCVDAAIGCGGQSPCLDDGVTCPAGCTAGGACDGCCSGACTSDGACGAAACKAPGDPCQMVPDHGCCPGYTCFEGVCDNPRGCFGPGDPCSSNSDCCEGSCSDSGTCYCTDPSRPAIGCSCDPTDTNACGGRPDLCCTGTCISPMAECMPPQACDGPGTPCTVGNDNCCQGYTCFEGICDNPKGCAGAGATCSKASDCCEGSCSASGTCYCTDPDRPDIGCSCDPSEPNACGGRPDLCCAGHCISPMANCS